MKYNKDINKYLMFSVLSGTSVLGALRGLFIINKGISFGTLTLMMSMYTIVRIIADVPLGVVADNIGKKNNIILGAICKTTFYIIISFTNNIYLIFIAYLTLGLADTSLVNSKDSYLYELVSDEGNEYNYTEVIGHSISMSATMNMVLNLIGAVLFSINPVTPFLVVVVIQIMSLLLSFTLTNNIVIHKDIQLINDKVKSSKDIIVSSYTTIKESPRLRTLVFYAVIVSTYLVCVLTMQQPYMTSVGLDGKQIGIICAVLQLSNVLAGKCYNKVIKHTKGATYTLIILILILAGTLLREVSSYWGVGVYALISFVYTIKDITFANDKNKILNNENRTTVTSLITTIENIVIAFVLPILGNASDKLGVFNTLTIINVLLLIVSVPLVIKMNINLVNNNNRMVTSIKEV